MPNSEISNLEVRDTISSLPPFIKKWSTILVVTMLSLCLLLTQLIKFKNIVSFPVALNTPYNLPKGGTKVLTLNGFVTNDQKNQLLNSNQCVLKFYNAEMAIRGKISALTQETNENQYVITFTLDSPQDLAELNKFSGDISGSMQVINLNQTVLKKIITNYIR
jgi:hypothetical protein